MNLREIRSDGAEKSASPIVLGLLIREGGSDKLWGSELSYLDLANSLETLGARVFSVETHPSQLISWRPRFQIFQLRRRRFLPFRLLNHAFNAIRICRAYDCDVVYAHADYWVETVFAGLAVSLVTGRPLYLGVVDKFKEREDRLSATKFLRARLFKRPYRNFLLGLARRAAARSAEACVVVSDEMAAYASNVLHAKKTVVIGRGVSGLFFERGEKKILYDACFAGRISKEKGVPQLLEAWQEVIQSMPNAMLALAGAGKKRPEMEAMTRRLGLTQNVRFLGYLSSPLAMHSLYQSSKLFVLPTRREGFARAVSEAMASGTPCIVSDLPELRSVYANSATYVKLDDKMALASTILRLLRDGKERARLAEIGSNYAKDLTWQGAGSRLLDTMRDGMRHKD